MDTSIAYLPFTTVEAGSRAGAWHFSLICVIAHPGRGHGDLAIYRFPPKNPPEKPRKHNIWCMRCGKAQYRVEMPMHPTRFTSCGAHRIYGHFSGIATAYCVSQGPSGI